MDLGLKGKKVIVTGGSRGLGRAALEYFASEGADVAFFSRNAEQVATAAKELKAHGGKVFAESFEVVDMTSYAAWLEKAVSELGGCDIFIHNMSSSGAGGSGDWDMSFNLDIKGAVTSIEALEPHLEKSDCASIIFMSSTAAIETFIRPQAFNAMKAALITYGSQLSQSLGPKGIRVNMVSPGPTSFPGGNWSKVKDAKPDFYASQEALVPLGRLGTPDDVAKTVVFLASPASGYTTGTNVIIDGGYTKRVQF
jgi:NAD(P)-dependent dehydrogenase (short-subunit alcohol dehydrogenase family)